MLKEYLEKQPERTTWSDSMPGVRVCRFTISDGPNTGMQAVPICGKPFHFETIFCQKGCFIIRPLRSAPYVVEAPGLFLLSDSSGLDGFLCSGDFCGILVAVDARSAKESLTAVCAILGMELDIEKVKAKMTAKNGCMALRGTPWTQALFEDLRYLPELAQERYCVFKAVELLYLFCSGRTPAEEPEHHCDGYVSVRMLEVKTYVQSHLSEKITIQLLCKQFSVSPTCLKEDFRRTFGTSIHRWLVEQRIRRARELICTTRMPIQQVALAVGYEGMSQFNAAFKRRYGMTPGQFRKMSETATLRPF